MTALEIDDAPLLESVLVVNGALTVPPTRVAKFVAVSGPVPASVPDKVNVSTVSVPPKLSVAGLETLTVAPSAICSLPVVASVPPVTLTLVEARLPSAPRVSVPPATAVVPV